MIYLWNILTWAKHELPYEVRKPTHVAWVQALLKPLSDLHAAFLIYRDATIKKMRYNGQTCILQELLNDLFDPTLRRIIVLTTYDIKLPEYIYTQAENTPLYVYTQAEYTGGTNTAPQYYLQLWSELGVQYDFIVQAAAGSLTADQITRLKATVRYYKLAGKKPYYQYNNNTPF